MITSDFVYLGSLHHKLVRSQGLVFLDATLQGVIKPNYNYKLAGLTVSSCWVITPPEVGLGGAVRGN